MKKLYLYIIGTFIALTVQSQSSLKDFIGLPLTDDDQQEVTLGTTKISAINGVSVQQAKATSPAQVQPQLSNTYSIDKTKDVGEIDFSTSVDAMGNFNVKVPINLYQNPKGLTPEVSLAFNSASTTPGNVGAGWNIGGLSCINRVNKNMYYDEKVQGVALVHNSSDYTYTLDGQRLISLAAYTDKRVYQTEQGNIKVIGYQASIDGDNRMTTDSYFEVFYPDGRKATFGDKTDFYTYPLMQIEDKVGNKIKYTYSKVNSNYLLTKITYGDADKISVEFTNTSLTEPVREFYRNGTKVSYNRRLTKITSKFNGQTICTYDMDYVYSGGTYVIQKIKCSASDKSLNPLYFQYSENNASSSYDQQEKQLTNWLSFTNTDNIRTIKGKFDYGGETDGIIMVANKIHYLEYKKGKDNYINNKYTGTEDIVIIPDLSGSMSMGAKVIKTEAGFVDIFCADINNLPEEEIIKVNNFVSGDKDRVQFHVYGFDILQGIVKLYTRTFDFDTLLEHNNKKSINPKFYYTGDFIGNGKSQVLVVSGYNVMGKGKATVCYLIDLESNKILYEGKRNPPFNLLTKLPREGDSTVSGQTAHNDSHKLYPFDYNGDGKIEFGVINDEGTHIYSFSKIRTDSYSLDFEARNNSFTNKLLVDKELYLGDFNGDGKTDFLLSPKESETTTTWKLYYSKANGTFEAKDITLRRKSTVLETVVHDVDNDGITDIICKIKEPAGSAGIYTYFVNNGKAISSNFKILSISGKLIPTSLNSKNYYNKLLCLYDGGKVISLNYKRNYSKERMISWIGSSTGIVTKIGYEELNRYDGYKKGDDAVFPYCNYKGGHTVVTDVVTYRGGEAMAHLSYEYENAILHKQGLGFRGFKKVNYKNTLTSDYYYQTFNPYEYSSLTQEETRTAKNTYTYSHTVNDNKIRLSTLTKQVALDKVKNVSVTTSYTYDSYGNPATESIDYGNSLRTNNIYTYTHKNSDTEYRLGLLTAQQTTDVHSTGSSIKKKNIIYNDNYLPTSVKTYNSSTYLISTEEFEYDAKSNLTTSKKKPYTSSQWQTEKYTHDSFGRITKKTNPLNHSTSYVYNALGLVSKMTDHKGNETTYTYDVWGRPASVTEPYGSVKRMTYQWNSSSPENAVYIYTQTETVTPTLKVYKDALGRVVRESSQRFDGKYLHTDKEYDAKGRLQKESLPYKEGQTPLWNTYTYDTYDRITKVVYATEKTETHSYSGLSVTSKTEEVSTTRTYNTRGWVTKVVDPGGTITYNYFPDGKILSITAPGSLTTSFSYDLYGRRLSITDPSAGKTSFTYDAAGNVTRQTDAKGNVTTMTYDNFNRMTKKVVGSDLNTTYTYNSDGTLASKVSTNGTSTNYTYDKYMRVSIQSEKVDSYSFTQSYTYAQNRLAGIRYNTLSVSSMGDLGSEVYNYAYGSLNEIIYNEPTTHPDYNGYKPTTIWKVKEEDQMGRPATVQSARMERGYKYHTVGEVGTRTMTYNSGTTKKSYFIGYDKATGNLLSKIERGFIETYEYDGLNRLTKQNSTVGATTLTYDEKGNITKNSAIGSFGYNSSSPYAISSVAQNTGVSDISKTVQNITYNSMNRPKEIEEGEWKAVFTYNSDNQRSKMVVTQNGKTVLTRYYLGNKYEGEGTTSLLTERLYIGGDAYTGSAAFTRQARTYAGNLYHILRDNQGSIVCLFDNSTQNTLVQEMAYDPWGRLKNPSTNKLYSKAEEPQLILGRGYTGHEHLPWFGLINMNARLYDPVVGRFLSPDPHVQFPDFTQNFNRYSYCLNNPLKYTDPDGEIVWFIPVIVGAVIGAYTGASIQSETAAFWNWKGDSWKGAIAGGFIGAAAGGLFASGIGASGIINAAYGPTKAFGTTSVILNSASLNVGMNAISGGGWDGAWKAGIVGAASGAWTAAGGFGMVKAFGATNEFAKLGGKLGYQMIGTAGSSIGNNWSAGKNPLSAVTLGAGPVNFTLGKGQKLLSWKNNLGNIGTATLGMGNLAFGGKVSFDWKNLSLNYSGGLIDKAMSSYSGYGAHSVFTHSNDFEYAYSHELHHLWQSRSMGDVFLLNYTMQGITSWIIDKDFDAFFEYFNYFEDQAYGEIWW